MVKRLNDETKLPLYLKAPSRFECTECGGYCATL